MFHFDDRDRLITPRDLEGKISKQPNHDTSSLPSLKKKIGCSLTPPPFVASNQLSAHRVRRHRGVWKAAPFTAETPLKSTPLDSTYCPPFPVCPPPPPLPRFHHWFSLGPVSPPPFPVSSLPREDGGGGQLARYRAKGGRKTTRTNEVDIHGP